MLFRSVIPQELGDASGLPKLIAAMRQAGYGEKLIAKICHQNWISAIERGLRKS